MKIFITDQGVIRGEHPDWKFPEKPIKGCGVLTDDEHEVIFQKKLKNYETALQLAKDHSIEFEDQEDMKYKIPFSPGIYTVDLPEVEMVEQLEMQEGRWMTVPKRNQGENFGKLSKTRTVFRFVERKEEKQDREEVLIKELDAMIKADPKLYELVLDSPMSFHFNNICNLARLSPPEPKESQSESQEELWEEFLTGDIGSPSWLERQQSRFTIIKKVTKND